MTDSLFISSPVSVLKGDEARIALETTNDAAYLTAGKGVLSVPLERWQAAQEYERATWLNQGLDLTEDRNAEHAQMFDGYGCLPINLGDVIELGCGPFTNLIHMLPWRTTNEIYLLDPLVLEYQEHHPNCTYRRRLLTTKGDRFGTARPNLYNRPVIVIPESIEDYRTDTFFDTIIMVNVLSHCLAVWQVFNWINAYLKTGSYLVFHEPARDIDVRAHFDIGHPLSYTQAVIDEFLEGYTPVYKNGDYFIGVKR